MDKSKIITVQIGNTIYPVENGWVMFGLGKKITNNYGSNLFTVND